MKWSILALVLLCNAAIGCESPIVGASCRPGFAVCADGCVDLQEDYRNCGECDNNCGQYLCKAGKCSVTVRPGFDAGPVDASVPNDAGVFDPDTGIPDSCGLGSLLCDGTCTDVASDPRHCGACGHACAEGELCAYEQCFSGDCPSGLRFCGGVCEDVTTSPKNCGHCGLPCASGICLNGACEDRVPARVVVIGHDLWDFNATTARIAGNPVFLRRRVPVRVLTYRGDVEFPSERGVEYALSLASDELGREYTEVDAVEALVPLQLNKADVFLIHSQGLASNSTLLKLGRQWANALAHFVQYGGTIVLFESPSAMNDGTYQILQPAHIFAAGGREEIPPQQLRIPNTELGVVLNVPDRYMSTMHTVRFKDISTSFTPLVVDADDQPVVLQRVIRGN